MGEVSTLYVIRHGQASFGAADYDRLTEIGVEQAGLLGLHLAGKARDLGEGIALAARTIDSGAARKALDSMVAITNEKHSA